MRWLVLLVFIAGCAMPSANIVVEQVPRESNGFVTLVYFCPRDDCEQHLYDLLDDAQVSIHCALFDLDLPRIIDLLHNKSQAIDVKVIMDSDNYENIQQPNLISEKSSHGAGEAGVGHVGVPSEE